MDHIIPFVLWRNNDTWNLLPADSMVNNSKRDRLPERSLLNKRRDVIIQYWRIIRDNFPERFRREMTGLTGRVMEENWEKVLFSALSDAVEFTALQRGVERWTV